MIGLLRLALPGWARWAFLIAALLVAGLLGQLRGERIAGERHVEYVTQQARQTAAIAHAQAQVVVQTEIRYRDRIQKIYVQGKTIEKEVPVYVTQRDDDRCTVNAGFVRSYNAAWSNTAASGAAESDRESAGVALSAVAEVQAHNAAACHAWREQALAWRAFYDGLRATLSAPAE